MLTKEEIKRFVALELEVHSLSIALCKKQYRNGCLKNDLIFKGFCNKSLESLIKLYRPAFDREVTAQNELFKDVKEEINLLIGDDDEE